MTQNPLRKCCKRWCKQTASHIIILPAGSSENSQHALLPLLGMFWLNPTKKWLLSPLFIVTWVKNWLQCQVLEGTDGSHQQYLTVRCKTLGRHTSMLKNIGKNILFFSRLRNPQGGNTLDMLLFKRRVFPITLGYFRKKYNCFWKLHKQTIPFTLP